MNQHTLEPNSDMMNLDALPARLAAIRDALAAGLIERDLPTRLGLLAMLAGEHLLLIGPPGTAKSLIARRLRHALADATYFERLLTRFSVPEELFGPLSIKGLEADRYERLTTGYLPQASVAFLDEIFKANSAILNALLTLLNEREFDNGTQRQKTPLVSVVGASNELPEGPELGALYDRFLFRLHVGPVSTDGFTSLLRLRGSAPVAVDPLHRLTREVLDGIRACAVDVNVPPEVEALLCALRAWCIEEGIEVSDRRWRKVVGLLQVAALTNGRDAVSIWDCWLLQHCLWAVPEDRKRIHTWYTKRVGATRIDASARLRRLLTVLESRLAHDQNSRSQRVDEKGRLLYLGKDGRPVVSKARKTQRMRNEEPLYLAPPNARQNTFGPHAPRVRPQGYTLSELENLMIDGQWFNTWSKRGQYLQTKANWVMETTDAQPAMEPTRHPQATIERRLADVEGLHADVDAHHRALKASLDTLERDLKSNLWVSDDLIEPATGTLKQAIDDAAALLSRVERLKSGFELLPVATPFTLEESDA